MYPPRSLLATLHGSHLCAALWVATGTTPLSACAKTFRSKATRSRGHLPPAGFASSPRLLPARKSGVTSGSVLKRFRRNHISMSRRCVAVFHEAAGERSGVIRHLGSLDDGDHLPWSRNSITPPFRGLLVITRIPKPVLEVVTRRLLGDLITSSYRLQAPSQNCIYIRHGRSSLDSSLISILILTIYTVFYQVPYPLHKPTTINQHVRKHDYFVD